MQSPARPLSETEKGRRVAEVKEGGRRRESQAPLLKQTWADVFRAPHSRILGPQLPAGLMGALTRNLSAGPGCAASLRGESKYLQLTVAPAGWAPQLIPCVCQGGLVALGP